VAHEKVVARAQIALTWSLGQKPSIVPVPSLRKLERLDENIGAVNVELTSNVAYCCDGGKEGRGIPG
jgi:aryl-alcohol dehydrogenase-like predicted oxidoreductase